MNVPGPGSGRTLMSSLQTERHALAAPTEKVLPSDLSEGRRKVAAALAGLSGIGAWALPLVYPWALLPLALALTAAGLASWHKNPIFLVAFLG